MSGRPRRIYGVLYDVWSWVSYESPGMKQIRAREARRRQEFSELLHSALYEVRKEIR